EFQTRDGTRVLKQTGPNQFRWPNSPLLTEFNYVPDKYTEAPEPKDRRPTFKGFEFGADILRNNSPSVRDTFKNRDVYLYEYSSFLTPPPPDKMGTGIGMADRLWPTQFLGGWQSVLRHVNGNDSNGYGWGQGTPMSAEVWLALEDLWVQRSL